MQNSSFSDAFFATTQLTVPTGQNLELSSRSLFPYRGGLGYDINTKNLFVGNGDTWNYSGTVFSPDNLTVYVSVIGNNNNNGLTISQPVKTLLRALDIIRETGWNDSATIRLLPGNYDLEPGILSTTSFNGQRSGMPLHITGDSMTVTIPSTTVTVVSGGTTIPFTLTVTSPVTNVLDGCQILFLTGALAGSKFTIGNVSGNTFTMMYSNSPAPQIGDTLSILSPNVSISAPNGSIILVTYPLLFTDLDFLVGDISNDASLIVISNTVVFFNGIRFKPIQPSFFSAIQFLGRIILGIPGVMGLTPANNAGVAFVGNFNSTNLFVITPLGTALITQRTLVQDCDIGLNKGTALFGSEMLFCRSNLNVDGGNITLSQFRILSSSNNGITTRQAAYVELDNGDVSNCGLSGVRIYDGRISIGNITSLIPNGNLGLELVSQANAQKIGNTSITGVNGDVKIGSNAIATWADINTDIVPRSDYAQPSPAFCSLSL